MLSPYKIFFHLVALFAILLPATTFSQRRMEFLNRGIVAAPDGKGHVFVSWRLLVTDKDNIAFNLYRWANNAQPVKLNTSPITTATSWLDEKTDSTQSYTYQVAAVVDGKEVKDAHTFTIKAGAQGYISISLKTPAGYTPN